MKKIRKIFDTACEQFDRYWKALPLGRQRRYTLFFFLAYLLLTAAVMLKVWCDGQRPAATLKIDHIDTPVLRSIPDSGERDSVLVILKKQLYETERE